MKFELNEKEAKLSKEFIEMCHLIEGYRSSSMEEKRHLSFSYIFSKGGGIGQASSIECEELGIGISLTDYSAW